MRNQQELSKQISSACLVVINAFIENNKNLPRQKTKKMKKNENIMLEHVMTMQARKIGVKYSTIKRIFGEGMDFNAIGYYRKQLLKKQRNE